MSIIFQHIVRGTGGTIPFSVGSGPIVGGINNQGLITNASGEIESVLDGVIANVIYALPFDADSRLVVSTGPVSYFDESIPFTASGAVAISGDTMGDYFNQGVAYKEGGGLVSTNPAGDTPGQVQSLVLTIPIDNEFNAAWDAIVAVPAVTSYTVQFRAQGDIPWLDVNVGLLLTLDIPGLDSGVEYECRVFATNAGGDGPASVIESITVEGVPDIVTGLTASSGDVEQSELDWIEPTASPAINDYDIQYKEASSGTWIQFNVTSLDTSETVYDLSGATLYDFQVRAVNSRGDGAWSSTAQGTPTAIGSGLEQKYSDIGLSADPAPISIANEGLSGSAFDFGVITGSVTRSAHKSRECWQTNGQASMSSNTLPVAQQGHPQTVFWTGIPFFLDGNFRHIWSSSFQISDGSARITDTNAFAGVGLSGQAMDTTGTEWLVVWRFNGTQTQLRVIKNGGVDSTVQGNTGSANLAPEAFHWNGNQVAGEEFPAQFFEFRRYNGFLSDNEVESVVSALKQKWFLGTPGPTAAYI